MLGGYRQAGTGEVIVFVRPEETSLAPSDCLIKLDSGHTVRLSGFDDQSLTVPDWPVFAKLKLGDKFRVGGQVWQKLCTAELDAIIGIDIWTVTHTCAG